MIDPNDPSYRPRPPRDHRMLAIGLCIAAIVCFVYAAFSHRWLENTGYRVGFSLIAFEACTKADLCQTTSTFALSPTTTASAPARRRPRPVTTTTRQATACRSSTG